MKTGRARRRAAWGSGITPPSTLSWNALHEGVGSSSRLELRAGQAPMPPRLVELPAVLRQLVPQVDRPQFEVDPDDRELEEDPHRQRRATHAHDLSIGRPGPPAGGPGDATRADRVPRSGRRPSFPLFGSPASDPLSRVLIGNPGS